jgi:hypothetical protein
MRSAFDLVLDQNIHFNIMHFPSRHLESGQDFALRFQTCKDELPDTDLGLFMKGDFKKLLVNKQLQACGNSRSAKCDMILLRQKLSPRTSIDPNNIKASDPVSIFYRELLKNSKPLRNKSNKEQ